MTDQQTTVKSPERKRADARIAISCLAFFGAMVGLAYASVPLYELFCRVTGYGGTTQRADVAPVEVIDREITVRFDANVGQGLGWDFAPEERSVTMKIGDLAEMAYVAGNPLSRASTGSATFNVTPQAAGAYFNKLVLPDFGGATTASLPYLADVNARGLIVFDTHDYGRVCCIPLGMSEVSTISFNGQMVQGEQVHKGQEMGMFNYGGSSFVIIYENLPDRQLVFMDADGNHYPQRPETATSSSGAGGNVTNIGSQIGVWYTR